MKNIVLFIFISFSSFIISQNTNSELDTLLKPNKNLFIEDYNNQLNIKFEVSNEIQNYHIPLDDNSVTIRPNLGIRYALVFNYRFISLRLGIRPKQSSNSKENEGESSIFKLRVKLLFDNWFHLFEYHYVKGYYITDTYLGLFDVPNINNRHVQFPNLTTNVLSGTSAYKLNENYSLKAIQSQTEIQIQSAGSFIPSIDYWVYSIKGTDIIINKLGEEFKRDNYQTYFGLNSVFNFGYYYTFVFGKNWYAHAFAIPGLGMDLYTVKRNSQSGSSNKNYTDFVTSFQTGTGIGYNSRRYYFGLEYGYRVTNEKYDNNRIQFHTTKKAFNAFVGYRFKPPKTVRKSVDKIQEKVPIFHDN